MVVVCPICKSSRVAPVFEKREIRVSEGEKTSKVGAELSAFRCDPEGHVFFVLTEDLKAAEAK